MFNKFTSIAFNASVATAGAALTVWLMITGHTLLIGGLLVALAAAVGTVFFAFRLADGAEKDELSIWAGPLMPLRASSARSGKIRV